MLEKKTASDYFIRGMANDYLSTGEGQKGSGLFITDTQVLMAA